MRNEFRPGSVWTPDLQREAVRRMTEVYDSPEMQALLGDLTVERHAPEIEGFDLTPAPDTGPIDADACVMRRARPEDIPACMRLLLLWNLPPLFIEEFMPGFIVAEHKGEVIGCGANEIYEGGSAVLRSIVVDERARKLKLGRMMSELLIEDAAAAGAREIYLFTEQARPFWLKLGFEDVSLDEWSEPARACWQWRYLSVHPDVLAGVFPMRRRVDG